LGVVLGLWLGVGFGPTPNPNPKKNILNSKKSN
jgi:hypothetical protein